MIELQGMHFHAHHGCYAEEKITGNAFEVSVRLRPAANPAPQTDNIADALNYQEVYRIVAEQMAQTSNLLEHVAQRTLTALMNHFPNLEWAEVTIAKRAPAMGGLIDKAQVTLAQERVQARAQEQTETGAQTNVTAEEMQSLERLITNMRRIRRECPWDAKQTIPSLAQYTTEEVYELFDAIMDENDANIRKELGDLLMHVLFYAVIGEETGRFNLAQIADGVNEKIIYRHPHVFQPKGIITPEEVERQWEALKLKEKGGNRTILGGVPNSLPPMVKCQRIEEKSAAVGFAWNQQEVFAKVEEEYAEVREALLEGDPDHIFEEFGDLLFTVIDAARAHHIDASMALERANRKFIARFNHVEAAAKAQGRSMDSLTREEQIRLWKEAKKAVQEVAKVHEEQK